MARITYNTEDNFGSLEDMNPASSSVKDIFRFPQNGENSFSPYKGGCNGKEKRSIMCILDVDMQRFKVLDIGEDGDDESMDEIA